VSDKSGYECGRRSMRKLLMCSSREREGGGREWACVQKIM